MSQSEVRPLTRVAFLIDNYQYTKHGCNFWKTLPAGHVMTKRACKLLDKMSFECGLARKNATGEDLRLLPKQIASRLRSTHGALALMAYGGHAMMYNGRLYFIPTDHASDLPEPGQWFLAAVLLMLLPSACMAFGWHGLLNLTNEVGIVLMIGSLGWIALARWFLNMTWSILTSHPLSNAVCLDQIEAELANMHETHGASHAILLWLLDCCRDFGHLSLWHRFLLRFAPDKPVAIRISHKNSRPNFFKVFACEEGRAAIGWPHGFLTEAFVAALGNLRCGGTLDELLTLLDENIRTLCSPGLQKVCIYSTSYRLAKQIVFWDQHTDAAFDVGPTLLTMRKGHLSTLKPPEWQLFHKHRCGSPKERKQILALPSLSDDLRAMLLLRILAEKRSGRGSRSFLSTTDSCKAIRRQGLRPCNVKLLVCQLNLMQAKFLCDKSIAVLGRAIMATPGMNENCMESVDRKMGRVEKLLARVICTLDQHATNAYLRGKVEEVIAGSIVVEIFKQLRTFRSSCRSSWPSLGDLCSQANECSGHFRRALHAYAEGSLAEDASRLVVIWRLSTVFAALCARDFPCLREQADNFNMALAAFKVYSPSFDRHWVIQRTLAVVNLGIQVVHPASALICKIAPSALRTGGLGFFGSTFGARGSRK